MKEKLVVIIVSSAIAIFAIRRVVILKGDLDRIDRYDRQLLTLNEMVDQHLKEIEGLDIKRPGNRGDLITILFDLIRRHDLRVEKIAVGPGDEVKISTSGSFNNIGRLFAMIEQEMPNLETRGFEIRTENGRIIFDLTGIYHY